MFLEVKPFQKKCETHRQGICCGPFVTHESVATPEREAVKKKNEVFA